MTGMATDPYDTLGVSRTATADEIRAAFRRVAKKDHPDLNPGNKTAEERFKAANTANEILSDPERRARFDRGEIDAAGRERAPERPSYAGTGPDEFGNLFDDFFTQQPGATRPRAGANRRFRVEVPFLNAVNGANERLMLPNGRTMDVRIPPGVEDGQMLRLRGKGGPGRNGGPDGDALIEVLVAPHPFFRRAGQDVEMDLPVTLAEAMLGGKVPVPTPRGEVTLTIPPGSDAGTRLRLRGRGVVNAGDLFVTLTLVAGPRDDALAAALRDWSNRHPDFDPRARLREQG